jgi:uncharacterized damage-inducible protein DinB
VVDISEAFVSESRRLLTAGYLPKIERCVDRLTDEDVWWRPNEASNSIGNLMLHLCGNVSQWIIEGIGGRPYDRHRQEEFDTRTPIPAGELLRRLRAVVKEADEVLGDVTGQSLLHQRHIQGYDVTTLDAIYHVVEHFSMHTGQIILITKARSAENLELWKPPQP